MPTIVIPFRPGAKSRLPEELRATVAEAMFRDVEAACAEVGQVVVAGRPGGQGGAVVEALRGLEGPVAVVNADLPCATRADIAALLAAAPALVAAPDGTTNALALTTAADFRPLYGPGSAARFGLPRLELPNLADDVDTLADLERLADRVGPHTRAALRAPVPA
jgi:2-phospho-L-lactate guanylyltransferase (CobY/MobA/RfbA family)